MVINRRLNISTIKFLVVFASFSIFVYFFRLLTFSGITNSRNIIQAIFVSKSNQKSLNFVSKSATTTRFVFIDLGSNNGDSVLAFFELNSEG